MTQTQTVLDVHDLGVELSTRRGTLRAVDGVSWSLARGSALGIVGESGSGKSITLRALMGLLPPEATVTSGRVHFEGRDLLALSKRELNKLRGPKLAMIFQEPMSALNPVMRVGEQIAEGPRVHLGLSRRQSAQRALELMARVGIPDPERRSRAYPFEFSGGMRQRVMIAIALSCHPEVVLCDEPTTALDVTIQDQILRLLATLCAEDGASLVFVTHDLPVVAQLCQSVAVMYAGRVVEEGTVADVFSDPHHPYTLGLLRSAPDVDDVSEPLAAIPGSPPSPFDTSTGCRFYPRCDFHQPDCLDSDPPLHAIDPTRSTACLHDDLCGHSANTRTGAS